MTTFRDRTPAPELSPAERAIVDRFEAAEAAPESFASRLGQAIGCDWIDEIDETDGSPYRICDTHDRLWPCLADAALAVMRGEQ